MNIIDRESFQGSGAYPFYTLALADHVGDTLNPCSSPIIICQYSDDDIVVYTYDKLDTAKAVFCRLCSIPGLEAKLA